MLVINTVFVKAIHMFRWNLSVWLTYSLLVYKGHSHKSFTSVSDRIWYYSQFAFCYTCKFIMQYTWSLAYKQIMFQSPICKASYSWVSTYIFRIRNNVIYSSWVPNLMKEASLTHKIIYSLPYKWPLKDTVHIHREITKKN